jgi:hypothetical protein
VTEPTSLETLRNLKVPSQMANSKALRDFLVEQAENVDAPKTSTEGLEAFKKILALLTSSHLEVVNALGSMEENLKGLKDTIGKFKSNG